MFSKKDWKYISILAISLIALFCAEFFAPKPLDWRKTYAKGDKIPYGNFVLFNQLQDLFGEENLESTNITAYELEESEKLYDYNSMFYIQESFSPSDLEVSVLMEWVRMGNNVFVASNGFNGVFADTFNLEQEYSGGVIYGKGDEKENALEGRAVSLTNPNLDFEKDFFYRQGTINYTFSKFDTATTEILGVYDGEFPNFIRIKYGEGYFYLNSTPLAFTNYNILLGDNHKYVSSALSYLPKKPILWDEYYKVGRNGPKTPLRFVLANPPLKWAWFTAIATMLVFILFNIKRKQRIIPIVQNPENHSLEFTETIGKLYFQQKDHKGLAQKKITFFKEYLRSKGTPLPEQFSQVAIQQFSAKSGVEEKNIKNLFSIIERVENTSQIPESDLERLNSEIGKFKEKAF